MPSALPHFDCPVPIGNGSAYVFDVTPIPEPNTWALVVASIASPFLLRTRRRSIART